MSEWYHSGLEGYCKAAADLLGNRRDGDSVLGLCRDLLPDRTSGTSLSHAWTLSSQRVGDRRCRQKVFETLWFNGTGNDASGEGMIRASMYVEEARAFASSGRREGGYKTIPAQSRYGDRLRECRDRRELERVAIDQCESDAIERCVQRVIDLYWDDEAASVSYLSLLVGIEDFPVRFFTSVVPAIESGLLSERYRPSDIQRFVQTLNGSVYMAHKCLLDGEDDVQPFRAFVTSLFAGLIYGPASRLALGLQEATPTLQGGELGGYDREDGTRLRLTQVFDERGAHTGYSELFDPSQVVFFGRSSEVGRYLERCERLLSSDPETIAFLKSREPVVFPIVMHPAVGRWHGMLLCENETWRYYDLDSTNGSSVVSAEGVVPVQPLIEIRAGDYLRVGASVRVDVRDANAYEDAATLHVSAYVDLAEDYV